MKVYSVHIAVSIREIGPIESIEPKAPISFSEGIDTDSPVKEVAQLFDKMKEAGAFPGGTTTPMAFPYTPGVPTGGNTVNLEESVQVTAGKFAELQDILSKYHAVTESLGIEAAVR